MKIIKENILNNTFSLIIFIIIYFSLNGISNAGTSDIEKYNSKEIKKLIDLAKNKKNKTALKYLLKAYKVAEELNNLQLKIESLKKVFDIYYTKKDYLNSLKYGVKLYNAENSNGKVSIDILIDLGDICDYLGIYKKSIDYYREALKITPKNNFEQIINLYINIGSAYGTIGEYKNELDQYLQANKIIHLTDNKQLLSNLLNNLGSVYASLNNQDKSLEFFNKSYALSVKIGDYEGIQIALNNLAESYFEAQNYKKAKIFFEKSLKICISTKNDLGIYRNLYGISSCLLKNREYSSALIMAKKALLISKKVNSIIGITENLLNISNIFYEMGNTNEALAYIKKADKIAKASKNLSLLLDINEEFYNYYEKTGNFKNAFIYLNKYISIRDKIYDEKNKNKIIEMQTIYESLEKDNKIALLNKNKYLRELEINRDKLIRNIFISAIIVIIILFILIYNRYRLKKKAHLKLELAHNALESANKIISEKNKHITDSIKYAQNIQLAILPLETKINSFIKEYFIFYKPKDIVSGDFYWFNEVNGNLYLAVVDCTGHGVPGAFMSMIGYSFLNQILLEKKIYEPSDILKQLSIEVKKILKQEQEGIKSNDGMDVCLCKIDKKRMRLTFSGARRPLVYIEYNGIKKKNPEILKIPGTRRSVGGSRKIERREFVDNTIQINKGDIFYLTSDGFADQSSPDGKKYGSSRLYKLFAEISVYDMNKQYSIIEQELENFKEEEQRDDITIFGVKIT